MLYRELNAQQASKVIDWCENHNKEYDIWNAAQTFVNPDVLWEIGLESWDELLQDLPELNGQWVRN